jgi:hypothetical protein
MSAFIESINRFHTCCDLKRLDEARRVIEEIRQSADTAAQFFSLGMCYLRIGMFEEAERALEIARPLMAPGDKQSLSVASELGTVKLHLGKFDEGAALEHLLHGHGEHLVPAHFPAVERDAFIRLFRERLLNEGTSVKGKTVFLFGTGGLGDNIEQYRNIERLIAEGARLVFADVEAPLGTLINDSALPVVVARSTFKNLEQCDVLALGNLLNWRYHRTPLASAYRTGYLKPVRKRDPSIEISAVAGKRKIGIVWKSSKATYKACRHEPFRSIDLATIEPLLEQADSQFFSLQFGQLDAADQAILARHQVIDASPFVKSFADLAEIMLQLDLVITIDSAPAHLAGALDVPVWNLLAKVCDWRWGDDAQRSTPLYPSMRLFRQPVLGDWTPVIAEVKAALQSA